MVLADRNSENLRNGRRSRGPSPSEHSSDLSTDEESGEKIRVGREYQAIIPPLIPVNERNLEECPDRALLVWSPTNTISDRNLDAYITIAKEKYGYNGEQALGMLFWHKHILQNAINDLPNFTPFPDEWTVEDKVLFEQAFQFHGKSFHRIRQMLPDKSIATLVKHYYSWKKTRCRTSLMDKHARKLIRNCNEDCNASDAGSEVGSNTDSDSEEKKDGAESKTTCNNCGVVCTIAQTTSKGPLCNSCYTHWRRTGCIRPTVGPAKPRDRHANSVLARSKRKPPRGMYINHDDLVTLSSAEQPQQGGDAILKSMDRDIVSLKRQVQNNKQVLSSLMSTTSDGLGDCRPSDNNTRINARWTNEEMLLAVQGIRMHGKDFSTIAEIIGTKTEAHVRSFYANQRKRYNLDKVVSEYEAEHGPVIDTEVKMEVDGENTSTLVTSAPSSPATPKHSNSNKVLSK
ncbi:REST corepressor 1 isoform X2 [Halyomorpha halys]|uniref:REST corepressor 1 isoform X2 n=1 Tax=Halyomorpha halys TaxID=286706 RepID=UPI0006D4DE5B|nr:REST corepressor 1 isoform X2 [Halyomorpha halys]